MPDIPDSPREDAVPGRSREDAVQGRSVARRLGVVLVAGVAVIAILHSIVYVYHTHVAALPKDVVRFFNMDAETAMPAWFNMMLLLMGAGLAALCGAFAGQRHRHPANVPHPGAGHAAESRAWWVLALGLGYLSLDEASLIHERFPALLGIESGSMATHEWLLPGVIVGAVGVTVLVLVGRGFPRSVRPWLVLGVVVYATGALGIEGVGGYLLREGIGGDFFRQVVFPASVVVEEAMEMLGVIVVNIALVSYLEWQGMFRAGPLPRSRAAR